MSVRRPWGEDSGETDLETSGSAWQRPLRQARRPPRLQKGDDVNMPGSGWPQIYVHFEFGVSLSGKSEPKPHSLTYMSRSLQQRQQTSHLQTSHSSHQLPTVNTNYLEQPLPAALQHRYTRAHAATHRTVHHTPSCPSHVRHHSYRPSLSPQDEVYDGSARHTRAQSAPTYERGSSAPPPMNDSPWDAEPEPVGFSALPRSESGRQSRRPRNASPPGALEESGEEEEAGPRFGNDGIPLTAYSWHGEAWLNAGSAEPSSARSRRLDIPDYGQARELAALSSAMMTVDNGFEDQWWFQGRRETHTVDFAQPTRNNITQSRSMPTSPRSPQQWVNATGQFNMPPSAASPYTPASAQMARQDTVSPISHAESSQPSAYVATQRSSDSAELFCYR